MIWTENDPVPTLQGPTIREADDKARIRVRYTVARAKIIGADLTSMAVQSLQCVAEPWVRLVPNVLLNQSWLRANQ
jgi:hypothetical protein